MRLFRDGESINKHFGLLYEKLRKTISEYSYIQLKDFSEDDIKAIAQFGEIDELIVDFENPAYTTQLGKKQVYDGFRKYNGQRESYWAETLDVTAKIQILQGIEYTKYKPRKEIIFVSGNETDVTLGQDDDKYYISFIMQFLSSEMKQLTSAQQKWKVNKVYREQIYTIQSRMVALNEEIKEFNLSLFEFVKNEIKKKVDSDSLLAGFSEAIGVQLVAKQENKKGGQRISILPKKLETALPDKKVYNGYYFDKQNYYLLLKVLREHLKATEILPKPIQKIFRRRADKRYDFMGVKRKFYRCYRRNI